MILLFVYLGIFLTLSIYHFGASFGRERDYSLLGFSIYNFAISLILIFRDILPVYLTNYLHSNIYNFATAFGAFCIAGGLIMFTYFSFILSKTRSHKLLMTVFKFSGVIMLVFFTSKLMLNTDIFKYIFFSLMIALCVLYIVVLLLRFIKGKLYLDREKQIIVISTTLSIPVLLIYSIIAATETPLTPHIFYITLLIVSCLYAYATLIKFNTDHQNLIDLKNSLQDQVKAQTEDIIRLTGERTDYLMNIAHEIKTPISIIHLAFHDYISDSKCQIESNNDLKILHNNINSLRRQISNFLTLERFSKGLVAIKDNISLDLDKFIAQKIELFKDNAYKKNIGITFNPDTSSIKSVSIDSFALDCILNNLTTNAIKYNKDNGKVDISTGIIDGFIFVTVKDTGIGISKSDLYSIFDEFYQVAKQKTTKDGFGLGLSLTKKFIEASGGSISVDSEIGIGSTFTIRLKPSASPTRSSDFTLSDPMDIYSIDITPPTNKDDRPKIFIIEDNIELLSILVDKLNQFYNIEYATDGEDAFNKLVESVDVKLIISDIMMDKKDGVTLLEDLRESELFTDIPFIFLTANTDNNLKFKGMSLGAVDFIEKPFDFSLLKSKIKSLLDMQESKDKLYKKMLQEELSKIPANSILSEQDALEFLRNRFNLTEKYFELLRLIYEGKFNKEICYELNLNSEGTVKSRSNALFRKLGVSSRMDIIKLINTMRGY